MKQSAHPLLAGAADADITPEYGIQLAGDIGRYRPTEEIRERLYVNALVLESGVHRCCLLSLDLLSATNWLADELRHRVAERLGIVPEAVFLHITQNHAAPSLGHLFLVDEAETLFPEEYPWFKGGDARYDPVCIAQCVVAAEEAVAHLQPVHVAVGRGIDGRLAHNRRFVMRDGTALTHPPTCSPEMLYPEGPNDPEIGVVTLTGEDGNTVATLLHYTCHPIFGYPHRYVIGDWPGAWAERVRQRGGGVPLVLNGCCGNIAPVDHQNPDHVNGVPGGHQLMAERLMDTTAAVLGRMTKTETAPFSLADTKLRLPLRHLSPEVITGARRVLDEYPTPKFVDEEQTQVDWNWVYAVSQLDVHARELRNPYFDYEIQAIRIGDVALVTLMGEPFVEAQLRIKLESPAPYTIVAHFCNGYAGYIPTANAFQRGGYETRTSNGSKFQPDALKQIADTALALLRELYPA